MSKFNKRVESKQRTNALENVFMEAIEDFSNKNPELTMNEVVAVFLKIMSDANNNEIKEVLAD